MVDRYCAYGFVREPAPRQPLISPVFRLQGFRMHTYTLLISQRHTTTTIALCLTLPDQ